MPFLSHYGDLPDISNRLSVSSLIFCIVTPLVVTARVVTRFSQGHVLCSDDALIILSAGCSVGLGILMLLCCAAGFGKHTKDVDHAVLIRTLKYFYVSQIIYKLCISLTKLSILCFYRRLFHVHRKFTNICDLLLAIIAAWIVAFFFATVFQCSPIPLAWDKAHNGGKGHCINLQASWYANATFNISTDFIITLLPMPIIRALQMRMRDKVMLCFLFALGFL